jgi:hypothetical protein
MWAHDRAFRQTGLSKYCAGEGCSTRHIAAQEHFPAAGKSYPIITRIHQVLIAEAIAARHESRRRAEPCPFSPPSRIIGKTQSRCGDRAGYRGNAHRIERGRTAEWRNEMLKKAPQNTLRALGPSEHYFWLSNQTGPKHFVMAAQISGFTTASCWQVALTAVQQRHPLLQVCIAEDQAGAPYFRRLNEARIPFRVVRGDVAKNWEREMALELATPVPLKDGLLARVVLIHEENSSTVIISAHHSIADGLSLTFIVRDLLKAVSGSSLERLQLTPSQESLCGAPGPSPARPQPDPPAPNLLRPGQLLDRNRSAPSIQSLRLSAEISGRLRERARQERTTVHGALVASLGLAGRRISSKWMEQPVRVISPVNNRKLLGLKDQCLLAILFPITEHHPQKDAQFWDVARGATRDLAPARTINGAAATFAAFGQLIASGPDVNAISRFELQMCVNEMMLSNLGVLPIETDYGNLTLEAVWGPSVFVGIEGEQMIGAATLHGAIHLLHSSYTPLSSLLQMAERILLEAVG